MKYNMQNFIVLLDHCLKLQMLITALGTEINAQQMGSVLVLLEPMNHNVFAIQDLEETSVNVSKIV